MINFTIKGKPTPQPRPRFVNRGKFVTVFDPAKESKKAFLLECMPHAPIEPFDEAVSVDITFYFPRPKSHFRTGKFANELKVTAPEYHTSKPDIDNLQKHFFDSLNGVFWKDDSVIDEIVAKKSWALEGSTVAKIIEPDDYVDF